MDAHVRIQKCSPRARVLVGIGVWSLAALLVAVAHLRVDARVEQGARQAIKSASDAWTSMVAGGISPDSASQLSLAILREGFRGHRTRWSSPFVERVNIDSVWQGAYLNPFLVPGAQTPRTNHEAEALRTSREDIRLATTVGLAELRRREAARLRSFDLTLLVGSVVVAGFAHASTRPRTRRSASVVDSPG